MGFRTWLGSALPVAGVVGAAVLFTAGARPPEPSSPVCDAGGPYAAECSGPQTAVQLDGSGSYDPNGKPLTFFWEVVCGGAVLDDPTSPTPVMTVDMNGLCTFGCRVKLSVTAGGPVSSCFADVGVRDSTPPAIVCPPDLTIGNGASTDPIATGSPTVTDFCNPNPTVTYVDVVSTSAVPVSGGGGPIAQTITRTWTADDGCQQVSCVQIIDVARFYQPHVDITPETCPNPFNPNSPQPPGSLQVSILGNEFDVADVNVETVRMVEANFDSEVDWIAPTSVRIADTATPFIGPVCGCHTLGPDGLPDLDMEFDEAV
jgi:hypothetical protein